MRCEIEMNTKDLAAAIVYLKNDKGETVPHIKLHPLRNMMEHCAVITGELKLTLVRESQP